MITIPNWIKNLVGEISKNSPVILVGFAVTGVVSTAILASRASTKANAVLEDELGNRYDEYARVTEVMQTKSYNEWIGVDDNGMYISSLEYSKQQRLMFNKKEIVKYTWKCYVPAVAVGAATIACIIGAHKVHLRRNAAIASLYSLTESAFKEYQEKVVETIGKNKELKVRDNISEDRIAKNPPGEAEIIFTGKGETLCYDSMSGRYFKTDIDKVKRIQNELNRSLMSEMFISLNEFYDALGLSNIRLGEDVGWNIDKSLIDISFSAQLTDTNDPCLVLNYTVVPRY